ncbi:MAG: hypothetical protein JJU01_09995, partial [Alkalibacterium sp.]|nr:hypothetical protein [Alkalibacterium sp.]
MKTQHKSMLTHFITLLFVIFQFVQFLPASLISAMTASAESPTAMTLFKDDSGSGEAKWTVNKDGTEINWTLTIHQAESETEVSPVVELNLPPGVGEPRIESATLNGSPNGTLFTAHNGNYRFNPQSYTTSSQKLIIQFKTAVSDLTSDQLAIAMGAAIEA